MSSPFDAIGEELSRVRNKWNRQLRMRDPDFHITVTQEFRIELLKHVDSIKYMNSLNQGWPNSQILGVSFTVVVGDDQTEPFRIWRST